ncbi:hypothetical protein ROLI_031110 [Roseobacter fucihabitans]|uniref:Uncharacterized protein n=1 Tax=Roseobacter fucihabitans TaxID=1537242 RepID=A0ABZ2BVG2_9RHOB|nr:hypothetical protein [Roseobacter litoralis]MBC6967168.1 hypothetical protein [Roseobacter litoralis]
MSARVEVQSQERGKIRVFAINKPASEIETALKTMPKSDLARDLLGDPHLNTASTEIFPIADLTGMGLGAYLSEGYAVPSDQIAPDRSKLDALEGYALLLFSDSFAGAETTLTPGEALTLIATYSEYQPPTGTTTMASESARPYSGQASKRPDPARKKPTGSMIIVLAIVVLAALVLWLL